MYCSYHSQMREKESEVQSRILTEKLSPSKLHCEAIAQGKENHRQRHAGLMELLVMAQVGRLRPTEDQGHAQGQKVYFSLFWTQFTDSQVH